MRTAWDKAIFNLTAKPSDHFTKEQLIAVGVDTWDMIEFNKSALPANKFTKEELIAVGAGAWTRRLFNNSNPSDPFTEQEIAEGLTQ